MKYALKSIDLIHQSLALKAPSTRFTASDDLRLEYDDETATVLFDYRKHPDIIVSVHANVKAMELADEKQKPWRPKGEKAPKPSPLLPKSEIDQTAFEASLKPEKPAHGKIAAVEAVAGFVPPDDGREGAR
jgi:hypothetical protein